MQFNNLLSDDDAVSPVIGVILMVAITVILAAVIGTFVLGLGDQVSDSAPQATFNFEFNSASEVTITHDGGDAIDDNSLSVKVDGATVYEGAGASGSGASHGEFGNTVDVCGTSDDWAGTDGWGGSSTDDVTAGSSLTLTDGSGDDCGGNDIRVIWASSSGGDTATLGKAEWSS